MRTPVLTLLCGIAFTFVSPRIDAESEATATSLKGWELYAQVAPGSLLRGKKEWRFGLLPGTNRLKTEKEIDDAITLDGTKTLQKELSRLEEEQSVILKSWLPESIRKEIEDFCTQQKLKFVDAAPQPQR